MTILEFPLSCSHANVDRSAQLFHRFCRLAVVINLFALVLILPLKPTCAEENSVATYTKLADGRIRVFLGGEFFAEYRSDFKGTPIVWPICAPGQTLATRSWPMIAEVDPTNEKDLTMREVYLNAVLSEKGGVKDHPHHRSLWFNHGDVNGGDFWGGTPATIRQAGDAVVETKGAVVTIITENLWNNDKQNRDICRDLRRITFGVLKTPREARFIDFSITITALEDNVVFGDTKEGSFGIRVPSPMNVTSKKLCPSWGGTILNDDGDKDADTWSKRSRWVNYTGPAAKFLSGEQLQAALDSENERDFPLTTLGIAVLDGPNSLNAHPWRHVRDYGLFASNPFGQRDFEPQNPNANGAQKLNKDESMTFNFRVVLHDGSLSPNILDQLYDEFHRDCSL